MVEEPTTRRSFPMLYVGMFVMFLLLVVGLFRMQILEGNNYKVQAQENRERTIPIQASRGIIYDRTGNRLVVNDPSYSVVVYPSDLRDFNCVTGQLESSDTFNKLADLLHMSNVVAIRPAEVPAEKAGEVANRLSVILRTPAETLRSAIKQVMSASATSNNLFPVRTDLTKDAANAIRADLKDLPGVHVYSQPEFNFVTRYTNCLAPVIVQHNLAIDMMQEVEIHHADLPGIGVTPEPVRAYPDATLFSHIVGYVGPISRDEYEKQKDVYAPDDKVGQTGIEASLEDQLRGKKGEARVVVNSNEQIVSEIDSQQPITGNNVMLTLDKDLQQQVTAALQDGLKQANVQAGVAIVVRVNDGQILSMVSLPSYDNNLFSKGISQADFDRLNNDPTLPMFNRAIAGTYPPGSTYKMITASAALQEGVVTPDTTEYCPGYIEVPYTWSESTRNTFRDWRADGQGVINIKRALTVSSDVFFYIMAGPHQEDRRIHKSDGTDEVTYTRYYTPNATKPTEFNGLGIDKLNKYAQAFGQGEKTGIELPGEASGLAPTPNWKISTFPNNPWSLGDTLVTAIGQGYNLMTPLQLVNVTAAVANGGTLYQPQVVLKVTDSAGHVVQDYQPKVLGKVPVSPENLAVVREGMRQAVADKVDGTAHRITLSSIAVAGKTGTAEFGDPIAIKDGKEVRRAHAWFTAFAPYDKPEIAVVVLLEGGQESLEGSTYAVPVADNILKAYFKVKQ